MESVILLEGEVNYRLTIDPGVWIFDDRKVDLEAFFNKELNTNPDQMNAEIKQASMRWDQEIQGKHANPPIKESTKKFEREKLLTGNFGMPLKPFLENAEPKKDTSSLIIETTNGESHKISLTDGKDGILGFAIKGKPITTDGPAYFYFGDGSNQQTPIKGVKKIIIE